MPTDRPMLGKNTRSQLERMGYGSDVETYETAAERKEREKREKREKLHEAIDGYRRTPRSYRMPKTESR